jgi:tRNA 2-thiouridine synthesizing protein E
VADDNSTPVNNSNQPAGTGRRYRFVAGRKVLFDEEDFFWHPGDWSEDIAEALARECGLEYLGAEHWKVIWFLRDFYFQNGRAPLNRQLAAGTEMSMLAIEKLFPGGIKHGARRLAGLPNPKACL